MIKLSSERSQQPAGTAKSSTRRLPTLLMSGSVFTVRGVLFQVSMSSYVIWTKVFSAVKSSGNRLEDHCCDPGPRIHTSSDPKIPGVDRYQSELLAAHSGPQILSETAENLIWAGKSRTLCGAPSIYPRYGRQASRPGRNPEEPAFLAGCSGLTFEF
jgi:hypothetical protein